MNPEIAIDLFKTTVMFALYTVAPFLITLMVVGLVSSLLQSVTSLQEPTLTFAPKLIALSALQGGRDGGSPGSSWPVPATLHAPIRQDAVLLTRSSAPAATRGFLESLKSPEVRAIIESFGYALQ